MGGGHDKGPYCGLKGSFKIKKYTQELSANKIYVCFSEYGSIELINYISYCLKFTYTDVSNLT